MFAYSFAAMTAYNIVQPVTRSAFITDLGADNLPYALLAAGVLVGVTMQVYARLVARLPSRWALPVVLAGFTGCLLLFWLLFRSEASWVSAGFYLFGQIFGTLLLSQFWTLANEIYDPRQARRLFGFVGGGASLGGMAGSGLAALIVEPVGTDGLLLFSAAMLAGAVVVVVLIARREPAARLTSGGEEGRVVGFADALRLIRESPSLGQITLLVSFSAFGAILLDQQLNMAAEQFRGGNQNAIASFLASVRFLLSASALLIQVVLVKQIYRFLGVGVALLILPVTLGITSALILVTGTLWAAAVASVVDRSIRYTVDRTTREIFFLPLPSAASAAIDLVGENELWNLTADVEHVLAHRDPKDWYVFESASWTLAKRTLSPERRRQRWIEPLPAASLVDRMRRLPLFASVGVDELFRIAGAGHQVRHDAGATLLREGAVPESLYLLLDGHVTTASRRTGAREIDPPAALGFEEALDGTLMAETVKTTGPAVSLALSTDQLRTLLSDNTDLVRGLFRTLAERRDARPGFMVTSGDAPLEQLPDELSGVHKVLALRRIPIFRLVSGTEILYLASIARQIALEDGEVLADETGQFGLGVVLSGRLALTTTGRPEPVAQAGPGDAVGVYETLAGLESVEHLQLLVTESGSALQIDRDELFDLLGQRPDLLQQMFAGIFDRHATDVPMSV